MMPRLLLFIMSLLVAGCASMAGHGTPFASGQEKKLAKAVELLEQKKISAATELLTEVSAQPGVPGVTDEALFRLSLLHLGWGMDKNGVVRAHKELDRLKREFPASPWAPLATILAAILTDDQVQIKKLKELNSSLTKENKDLHQSIGRLKTLELELGKGNTR